MKMKTTGKQIKYFLATIILAATGVAGHTQAQTQTQTPDPYNDAGVTIGGAIWATRNVGEPGKFVDNPSDAGRYYTFQEAKKVCPEGWRAPTLREFEALDAIGSRWTTFNGMNGMRYGGGINSVFLPAAGRRPDEDDSDDCSGDLGYYWSGTRTSSTYGFHLGFHGYNIGLRSEPRQWSLYSRGYSVRCVKKQRK